MKISVILPTYNEAGNIKNLIQAIAQQKKLKNHKLEFIVIDDNSPDKTADIVRSIRKLNLKLIIRKNTRGLATAILKGIQKSTGDTLVLMDTDFNHKPSDIPRLLEPILEKKSDLVIGSRYIPGGGMHETEANKFQFFASRFGNFFVNKVLLSLPVHESLSGFLVFKKKILKNLNLKLIFQGYGDYCIRLLYKAHQQDFRISEVSVVYGKRQYGVSKSRLYKMFIEYFKTAFSLKFKP